MKAKTFLAMILLALLVIGCKKEDNGTNPTPTPEDWTFPADTTTHNMTLYCSSTSVAPGASFDVKVILYNVRGIFGAASDVVYTSSNVQVNSVLAGPFFTPDANILTVSNISAASNTASFGVTYRAGTNGSVTGSGVVFKLKCTATATGTATFTINPATLEVRDTSNVLRNPPIGPALNIPIH